MRLAMSREGGRLSVRVWVPAFAGNTEGNKAPFGATRHFPQRGKIGVGKSSPFGGSTREAGVGGHIHPMIRR